MTQIPSLDFIYNFLHISIFHRNLIQVRMYLNVFEYLNLILIFNFCLQYSWLYHSKETLNNFLTTAMSFWSSAFSLRSLWYFSSSSFDIPTSVLYLDSALSFGCLITSITLGTKISAMLKKQQKIMARATNAKLASCWLAITIVTGAVIKQRTTTLYIDIPTYLESLICFTLILLVSYAKNNPNTRMIPL